MQDESPKLRQELHWNPTPIVEPKPKPTSEILFDMIMQAAKNQAENCENWTSFKMEIKFEAKGGDCPSVRGLKIGRPVKT